MSVDTLTIIHVSLVGSPAAARVVEQAVRTSVGGVTDLKVQMELEDFCDKLRFQLRKNAEAAQVQQIAELNAGHKSTPIIHIVIGDALQQTFDDLI